MEPLATLLPTGPGDIDVHRGARRASRRYPLLADVVVLEPRPAEGLVINASAGGMRIALDAPFEEGEVLLMRVVPAENRESVERARVVWTRALPDGFLVGLAFLTPPEE